MAYFWPADPELFVEKALNWASRFSPFVLLHSCSYPDPYGKYEWLLAVGAKARFESWEALRTQAANDWLFGHLSYEAHRQMGVFTDALPEAKETFPPVFFFIPEVVVGKKRGSEAVFIFSGKGAAEAVFKEIEAAHFPEISLPSGAFKKVFEREEYCEIIQKLRAHIYEGDCYEINFCNRREAFFPEIPDPVAVFQALHKASPAPFSACYRLQNHWLVSASPERYLTLDGTRLVSQPIKGTAPRFADPAADAASRLSLQQSLKDQAENVMIVDLTRSDLAKVCEVGSVQVEDLFGIQSFPQVFQMVSTVSGNVTPTNTLWKAIEKSFPMGSMTGAPRQKVMDLIRRYEGQERGPFSGSLGFVDPDGHADFNVIIRSVWGDFSGNAAFNTGGAITWNSTPEGEWEECLLKGRAIERLFSGQQ